MTTVRLFTRFVGRQRPPWSCGATPAYWTWLAVLGVLIVSGAAAYARQVRERARVSPPCATR